MGKLIDARDFKNKKLDSDFYFPPPQHIPYSVNGRGGYEEIEVAIEREFKHVVLIQKEHLENIDQRWWIDLRKLVERKMEGDVIWWYHSMDYKWCWNREDSKSEYDRKYSDVRHGYYHFDFEFSEDKTIFALLFGEMISEVEVEEINGMMKAPKGEYRYGGW